MDRDPDHELSGESTWTTHLHASAIGKLLLAQRPELIGNGPLRRITDRTKIEPTELIAELQNVQDSDAAYEVDESRIGRTALAVPVRTNDGRLAGALTATGRTGRLDVKDSASGSCCGRTPRCCKSHEPSSDHERPGGTRDPWLGYRGRSCTVRTDVGNTGVNPGLSRNCHRGAAPRFHGHGPHGWKAGGKASIREPGHLRRPKQYHEDGHEYFDFRRP